MFNKLSRHMKKTQIELLEMKTTVPERKNSLGGIKGRLVTTEEKISELKCIAIETIQNETYRGKRMLKNERALVNYVWLHM